MATDDELKRHMDVIAERMDDRFDRVLGAIGLLNEKVDRHRDEARDETAETQSMIRISYTALDQRITSLETLEARIQRLESAVFPERHE